MDDQQRKPQVLVVDDEEELTLLYGTWLEQENDVLTANGGEEALRVVDEEVGVVLLDRRMPGYTGDEVLAKIRDRGLDCRVVMVTAIEPDFDVIELGFDDYLQKPVSRDELRETVDVMLQRTAYDAASQRFFALMSKKETLEAAKSDHALETSDRYADLLAQIDAVEKRMSAARKELVSEGDSTAVFRDPPEWDTPDIQ